MLELPDLKNLQKLREKTGLVHVLGTKIRSFCIR
jgi:hypothetical protein